ncbi:MAG: SRPBCC domain-containing protein [Actinomycetota bacterium]
MAQAKHVFETFIRATPADVWAAITEPEFTRCWFHGSITGDLAVGGAHRWVSDDGGVAVTGSVEEVEPPHRLVLTWQVLHDPELAAEPPGRVEWIVTPANDDGSVTRLTVRHLDLGMSPLTSADAELGWVVALDSLKSLLETGAPLGPVTPGESRRAAAGSDERRLAADANRAAWDLLGKVEPDGTGLDADELDELVERAAASAYHWRHAAPADAPEQARASWMLARCHTLAGDHDAALRHARRCAALTATAVGAADFDRAYAEEALARASALVGRTADAAAHLRAARAIAIADDDEDRAIVEADLAAGPWFGLEG